MDQGGVAVGGQGEAGLWELQLVEAKPFGTKEA